MSRTKAADDPYAALGVARTATDLEIKAAYHERAKACHPDRTGDASAEGAEAFQKLQAAFALLSDGAARAEYDANLMKTARTARAAAAAVDADDETPDPLSPESQYWTLKGCAEGLLKDGQVASALENYDAALALLEKEAERLSASLAQVSEAGEPRGERLIALLAEAGKVHGNRSMLLLKLGRAAEAAEAAADAAAYAPGWPKAHARRAEALGALGAHAAAATSYAKAAAHPAATKAAATDWRRAGVLAEGRADEQKEAERREAARRAAPAPREGESEAELRARASALALDAADDEETEGSFGRVLAESIGLAEGETDGSRLGFVRRRSAKRREPPTHLPGVVAGDFGFAALLLQHATSRLAGGGSVGVRANDVLSVLEALEDASREALQAYVQLGERFEFYGGAVLAPVPERERLRAALRTELQVGTSEPEAVEADAWRGCVVGEAEGICRRSLLTEGMMVLASLLGLGKRDGDGLRTWSLWSTNFAEEVATKDREVIAMRAISSLTTLHFEIGDAFRRSPLPWMLEGTLRAWGRLWTAYLPHELPLDGAEVLRGRKPPPSEGELLKYFGEKPRTLRRWSVGLGFCRRWLQAAEAWGAKLALWMAHLIASRLANSDPSAEGGGGGGGGGVWLSFGYALLQAALERGGAPAGGGASLMEELAEPSGRGVARFLAGWYELSLLQARVLPKVAGWAREAAEAAAEAEGEFRDKSDEPSVMAEPKYGHARFW